MIDKIDSVVNAIGGFLYQPYIVPLFLIVAGLYFTIRTGLIQFRLFGESIHVVAEKPKEKGSISSFGALMVSTASRVGTGNIVGVSTAICLGGFGAVFWMWVVALLGGASAFIESALAQVYKKKDGKGGCVGGPSRHGEVNKFKRARENMIKKADKRNIHENLEKLGAEKIPMHRSDWTENK